MDICAAIALYGNHLHSAHEGVPHFLRTSTIPTWFATQEGDVETEITMKTLRNLNPLRKAG